MIDYFIYCGFVRVVLHVIQRFPFQKLPFIGRWWGEGKFLRELFDCDLCLGVWLYTFFAFPFKMNMLNGYFYVPVLSEILTGAITSFIVFILRSGWNANFQINWVKEK